MMRTYELKVSGTKDFSFTKEIKSWTAINALLKSQKALEQNTTLEYRLTLDTTVILRKKIAKLFIK